MKKKPKKPTPKKTPRREGRRRFRVGRAKAVRVIARNGGHDPEDWDGRPMNVPCKSGDVALYLPGRLLKLTILPVEKWPFALGGCG